MGGSNLTSCSSYPEKKNHDLRHQVLNPGFTKTPTYAHVHMRKTSQSSEFLSNWQKCIHSQSFSEEPVFNPHSQAGALHNLKAENDEVQLHNLGSGSWDVKRHREKAYWLEICKRKHQAKTTSLSLGWAANKEISLEKLSPGKILNRREKQGLRKEKWRFSPSEGGIGGLFLAC